MSLVLFLSLVSCATFPPSATSKGPRTIILDGAKISESDVGGFTSWYCKDFYNGGRILVEVGFFGDPKFEGVGFILYDGGYSGLSTKYQRTGLNHRWDWDWDGSAFDYTFTIKPDGFGQYYDFTIVPKGQDTSPSATYQCKPR